MSSNKKFNNIFILFLSAWCGYYIYIALSTNNGRLLTCLALFPLLVFPKVLRIFKVKINPITETFYLMFIFLAQFLGSVINFYSMIDWFDTFTHFLSGIGSGFIAFLLLVKLKHYNKKDLFFNTLFIMATVFLIAGVWELFEFSMDQYTGSNLQHHLDTGVIDTMWDTVAAATGGVIFVFIYLIESVVRKSIIYKFIDTIE